MSKKKLDRLKELEDLADKLGIGTPKEVECVSCKIKLDYSKAVVITNKKKVSYLCINCLKKLVEGKLTKEETYKDDILKEIEKRLPKTKPDIMPTPWRPEIGDVPDRWRKDYPEYPWKLVEKEWIPSNGDQTVYYQVYTDDNSGAASPNSILLKMEPHKRSPYLEIFKGGIENAYTASGNTENK